MAPRQGSSFHRVIPLALAPLHPRPPPMFRSRLGNLKSRVKVSVRLDSRRVRVSFTANSRRNFPSPHWTEK